MREQSVTQRPIWTRGPLGWSAFVDGQRLTVSRYRSFFPVAGQTRQRVGWSYVARPCDVSPPRVYRTLTDAKRAAARFVMDARGREHGL